VRGESRRIELDHLHQRVGAFCREPCRDSQKTRRRDRRDKRSGADRACRKQPLANGGAHRVPDQDGRRRQLPHHVLDVSSIIIEPDDKERVATARFAMSAQRQCMRGVTLAREPRQKIRVPEPAVAVAAMHEQERWFPPIAFPATGGQARTQLEVQLDGKHGRKGAGIK
jgi:hypothetical protein